MLISGLAGLGFIDATLTYSVADIADGLQSTRAVPRARAREGQTGDALATPARSTPHLHAAAADFIICVEMLIFACLHHYLFPASDYNSPGGAGQGGALPHRRLASAARDVLPGMDLLREVHTVRRAKSNQIRCKYKYKYIYKTYM